MAPKTKTLSLHRLSKKQLIIYGTTFALIGIILLYKSFALNPNLPGDVNKDNTVNITDLSILLSNYNTNYSPADFNSDSLVNILDMSVVLSNYGKVYSGNTSTFTIGETNILGTDDSGNGNLLLAQSAVLPQSATIKSMSFYVTNPAGKLRLSIYDSSGPNGGPGAKIAETSEITPISGWNTANVVFQVSLSAGNYWLAYLPSDNNLGFKSTQDSTSSGRYYSYAYGALPGTFSSSPISNGYHWSFYATFTSSGSGTPTPTVSLTANPTSITSGSSSTLSWSSTNAISCTASGAWTGSKATSGSLSVNPTSNSTYNLSCTGTGGTANASATVTVTSGGGGGSGALKWAPPILSNPITVNISNSNHSPSLNAGQDYIIKMPTTPLTAKGGLILNGGRNIVIFGGEIYNNTPTLNVADNYGISLFNQTGTVHIEGLYIHGTGIGQGFLFGYQSSTARPIVQIERTRIESLHTVSNEIHTDGIQSYGGPTNLKVYELTISTNGVGIQVQPHDASSTPVGQWEWHRINVVQNTADAYALWKNYEDPQNWPFVQSELWVRNLGNLAWAEVDNYPVGWNRWNPGGGWPISGEAWHVGLRPEGDYVPQSAVGLNYTSPGYQ
jgi:hypothetical protein